MKQAMLIAAIAMTGAATAQQAATTAQQDFDAATALSDKGDNAAALVAWEALERRVAKNPRTLAIVRVRKSGVLLALRRMDDAVAAARSGLAGLPTSDTSLVPDRYSALMTLGRIAEASLDYASAADAYAHAEPLAADSTERLATLRGLIETATFVDPAVAAAAVVRADTALATIKADPTVKAIFKRVYGQLLLNQGAFEASRVQSAAAVQLLGGLTSRTGLDDVTVRSNYAIAALLAGKKDDARRYMAMTGAGRLPKGSFDPADGMKMPECGGEAGLKPADVAVIEFSVADDGTVPHSLPVYAAGGGQVALEFARQARNWSWTAEKVKATPVFFRNHVRVELRCSTAFERPSIQTFLDGELGSWLSTKHVDPPQMLAGADAAVLPRLRTQLATAETASGKDALALVPILHLLTADVVVGREESLAFAQRELAIASAHGVPPAARLAIQSRVWSNSLAQRWDPKGYARLVTPALPTEPYASDPTARNAIRLLLADAVRANDARSRALLTAVGADAELPANHPLKVGALVRLASLEQDSGNPAAASAAFASSGLSARQCALVDSAPRFLGANVSSSSFPMEAALWGFEGWVRTQSDVSAEGKVVNLRVVASYPPFVFSQAGAGVLSGGRFEKSFRPDGGLGCGGVEQGIRFVMPGNAPG
ncbi:hypothetical protein [Sphingomonas endolithica]|uniref:hypothetical protein n=1 Tax=Sphingomonas endolithica TaxID=2972485 RepID=UPI0021B02F96|nr:hypothetical protein [Sphingomonas sp. ZFBP2030]